MKLGKFIQTTLLEYLNEELWHGSPHDFNEFLLDYMGSGEGAQAFGWGLYFTELEDIADRYSRIKNNILDIAQHLYGLNYTSEDVEKLEAMKNSEIINLINDKFEVDSEKLKNKFKDKPNKKDFYNHLLSTKVSLRDKYINSIKSTNPTKYYVKFKNNRKINELNWLQWDKELNEKQKTQILNQAEKEKIPTSKEITRHFGKETKIEDKLFLKDYINKKGKNLYSLLVNIFNSRKKASLFLLKSGIDGIKYPAESIARGKTSETARGFNYVIFDHSIVEIEKKLKY